MRQLLSRGPLLQHPAEGPDLLRQPVSAHRQGHPVQPVRQAHQQFRTVRKENRVDDRGGRCDLIQARDARLQRIHAVVLEVITKLSGFEELHRFPSPDEIWLGLLSVGCGGRALEQKIGQLEEQRTPGLTERHSHPAGADSQLRPNGLDRLGRPPVGQDGVVELPLCLEDTSGLPLPPVQGFRSLHLLGGAHRQAGQKQGLLIPPVLLVQAPTIPERIGPRAWIADPLRDDHGLFEHVGSQPHEAIALLSKMRTKLWIRAAQGGQSIGLVMGIRQVPYQRESQIKPGLGLQGLTEPE